MYRYNFFCEWKLKLNPSKSKVIIFHRKMINKFKYPPPVRVCSVDTPWRNQVKYLGLTIDHAVRWKPAIEERKTKAYVPLKKLYPLLVRNSSLPIKLKRLLYLTCVRLILTYGAQLWGGAPRTTLNRLQVAQNSYLRLFFKKKGERINNSKVHSLANFPPLKEIIHSLARNSYHQIQEHKNPLLE